jgi:hypothetical protein
MREFAASAGAYVVALTLLAMPALAVSQETEPDPDPASVHWAYSAYFGTGWYTVPGDRDVFVVRMTPRWTWSDAAFSEGGSRTLGKYLKFPVSAGLNRFDYDDPLEAVDLDNVSFLSVNPGIDVEIPVNSRWALRPYASVGYAHAFGSGDAAWTYWAGVKSRVSFSAEKFDWHLVNQVGYVGYTPDVGPSDEFWPLSAALEFDHPTGDPADGAKQLHFHWRVAYTAFGRNLVFNGNPAGELEISDQWEIGAAVGRKESPIRIWFLNFDRLGIGYRRSSSGDLKGVTFFFRSMFDE